MKRFPFPSTAKPTGWLRPATTLLMVGEPAGILPLTATISHTSSSAGSLTKTLPLPSTTTPWGWLKPLPTGFVVVYPLAARISVTVLLPSSVTKTFPFPSTASPKG